MLASKALLISILLWSAIPPMLGKATDGELPKIQVEAVASGLQIPWSATFSPDGRMFVIERPGRVRVIQEGRLLPDPIGKVDVAQIGEAGLLGIALDPDFPTNHFIYLYYTYSEGNRLWNRVSRFVEREGLMDEKILLDRIPGASVHDGGRIKFGPDGRLYITSGDATQRNLAQDPQSLAGKILRINSDGSVPSDNPFPGSPVFSLGHRNPQGIDWYPLTGHLVATEHGPSGERGFAHDEVNRIEPGKNYGWPVIVGSGNDPRYTNPLIHSGSETWAPSGAAFHRSGRIPEWRNKLIIATLAGQHLRVLGFDDSLLRIITNEVFFKGDYGRIRDVVEGPDGALYVLTSNRDGRGSPRQGDDKILRLIPAMSSPKQLTLTVEGKGYAITFMTQAELSALALDVQNKVMNFRISSSTTTPVDVSIPSELLGGPYSLKINTLTTGFTTKRNSTHGMLSFLVPEGVGDVAIGGFTVIPEFPVSSLVLLVSVVTLMVLVLTIRQRRHQLRVLVNEL